MEGLRWIFFLAMVILAFRVGLIHRLKDDQMKVKISSKSGIMEGLNGGFKSDIFFSNGSWKGVDSRLFQKVQYWV